MRIVLDIEDDAVPELREALLGAARHAIHAGNSHPLRRQNRDTRRYWWFEVARVFAMAAKKTDAHIERRES